MDDHQAEAKLRQSLGLSDRSGPSVTDDPQRLARQAIRSQAAARDYAERQLAHAERMIEELQAKLHAIRRENAVAVEAVRAAHAALAQAERGRRAAEAALINEKSVSDSAQREAREARATVQDLRIKLAEANQAAETLRTQLEQVRQVRTAAALDQPAVPVPVLAAIGATHADGSDDPPMKRRRGRPPGKRDAPVPRPSTPKPRKAYTEQEPVQWWTDGWTPHT